MKTYLAEVRFAKLTLRQNHVQRSKENNKAVTDITKHDCEQEREGNNSEQAWVDFLIGRNPIAVHNGLEAFRKLVSAGECWWRLAGTELMKNRRDTGTRFLLYVYS